MKSKANFEYQNAHACCVNNFGYINYHLRPFGKERLAHTRTRTRRRERTRWPRAQDRQDFVLLFLHGVHPVRETGQCHLDDQQKQEDKLTYMCLCTFTTQVVEGRITWAPDTPEARKNCPPKKVCEASFGSEAPVFNKLRHLSQMSHNGRSGILLTRNRCLIINSLKIHAQLD